MNIKNEPVSNIKPYAKNCKKHSRKQVKNVAESIKQYGFVQPIVIDKDNCIVIGHCRYEAARLLNMEKVPCVRVDSLTDEQIKQLRIVDNKANESEWDWDNLEAELFDLDLEVFDFDLSTPEEKHQREKEKTQLEVENILNLAYGQYYGENPFDFPELKPVYEIPEIKEWIGFNYVTGDKEPEGKGVHFFIDDYQFERIWNNPKKYLPLLQRYACVLTPDFSPYGDMPLIAQMWNHYRKHWIGAFLQENGVTVVPTIRCSTDERSLEWYLDGEPKGGIVAISAMWTNDKECDKINREEYRRMKEVLHPCRILIYGKGGNLDTDGDNVEFIESFAESRFGRGKR